MKSKLYLTTVLITLSACFSPSVKILEVEKKELADVVVPKGNYKILYVAGNATTQNVIQVVSISNDNSQVVLKNYERYNALDSYKLLGDTILQLVVRDTISYLGNKPDTFLLKLE
jgi:hypothetical protein